MPEEFHALTYRLRNPCGIGAPSDHDSMEVAAGAIERLRAALAICAADYVSPPCTVGEGAMYLGKEFERRAYVARDALQAD